MANIILIDKKITIAELKKIAEEVIGDLVKAVVDVEKKIMAIGGEMHSDEEEFLLEQGSSQEHLWGINIYPENNIDSRIEFDSMINVRSRQNNRSRSVENLETQKKIIEIVNILIKE